MEAILLAIRDWLPSIAVIVGGAWVLYRFIDDKDRSIKTDLAALYGTLKFTETHLTEQNSFVLLSSDWKNTSPLPIDIDPKKTRFDIYKIKPDIPNGPLNPKKDLGAVLFTSYPLHDMEGFIFEPKIESQVRASFVLRRGEKYFVRAKIYKSVKKGDCDFAWTRETTLFLS